MKLTSKIIIGILPFIIACTNTTISESNTQKKDFYSLTEYEANPKSIGMGEEYVKVLKDKTLMEKEYSYALEKVQTIKVTQPVNNIADILKRESFFDEHKKVFDPFDASSLSRIIYHQNRALVSFGLPTDEHSFTFGDYILELKEGEILVYKLGVSGACGGEVIIY